MTIPLQITIRDMAHSEALDASIREKAARLEAFYPNIMSCRVVVEIPHKHKHQGKLFNVRVDVTVPGHELVFNRDLHEDVHVALRDAFDAAKRRLEDMVRVQRGDVKSHTPSAHGRVARIDGEQGFGFIETSDGRELYFARDNVVHPGFDQLRIGDEVQFVEEVADEGLQAKRVSVGKHHFPG